MGPPIQCPLTCASSTKNKTTPLQTQDQDQYQDQEPPTAELLFPVAIMTARGFSLRDKQIASLRKILNLNDEIEAGEHEDTQVNGLPSSQIVWKVLVFDDLGREYATFYPTNLRRVLFANGTRNNSVISSVLRVSDLRSLGVTIHM